MITSEDLAGDLADVTGTLTTDLVGEISAANGQDYVPVGSEDTGGGSFDAWIDQGHIGAI